MKNLTSFLVLLFVASASVSSHAKPTQQIATQSQLTVETIFDSDMFKTNSFSPDWQETGSSFIRRKPSGIPGNVDLVLIEPRTNQETVLLTASQLMPEGSGKPLSIASHQWTDDKSSVLIFTNTQKVWRQNTRGDYWVKNLKTNALRQIGASKPPTSLMFAKFSPDGRSVAYVSEGDIYLEDVATGDTKRLTEKRTPEIINGTSDWVYEEEFDVKDGFRWSPDGSKIAFWEFDTSEVGEFTLINNTDSLYPKLKKFKHTKPGQKNSAVRMGIIDIETNAKNWLNVPGDRRENYLPRARWTSDKQLLLQDINRDQNRNSVLVANATNGETKELFQDTDPAWIDTCDHEIDLDNKQAHLWISEKDGWRHVYRVDAKTGEMRLLTEGELDVHQLVRVTDDSIYFLGSQTNPTERYLFRAPATGGPSQRITPENFVGWNTYDIAPDGSLAFHTFSKFGLPPVTTLVDLPSHNTIRTIVDNAKAKRALESLTPVQTDFVKVGVEDVLLDAWLMKPANFDATKKYPLIVYVYGEPWGTTVNNSWGSTTYLWHRMLAEKGYAVCSIDNRGTKVPRGREFRKMVYGKVGISPPQDQASAVKALTTHFSWLDNSRVGVWGWSGGGSMTLNAMFKYPEIYHTGVSIAAVPNMMYYDSIYQERYMGTPAKNPDGYKQGSPIHFAKNLKGNLMIVHGTGDDNCHYQTVELLINELVKLDKQFSMMAYPNRSHSINEGANTTVHLRKLMTKYFLDNLPAGGR